VRRDLLHLLPLITRVPGLDLYEFPQVVEAFFLCQHP
jgi:hypothetical protein